MYEKIFYEICKLLRFSKIIAQLKMKINFRMYYGDLFSMSHYKLVFSLNRLQLRITGKQIFFALKRH